MLHPRYLLGALDPAYYAAYKKRNASRGQLSYKAMSEMMIKNNLVKIKEHPPYTLAQEDQVLLNSVARASKDAKTGEYTFKPKQASSVSIDIANSKLVSDVASKASASGDFIGVGVDQGKRSILLLGFVPSNASCL